MTEIQTFILIIILIIEAIIFSISAVIMEEDKKFIILDLCINGAMLIFIEVLFFGYCFFSAFL